MKNILVLIFVVCSQAAVAQVHSGTTSFTNTEDPDFAGYLVGGARNSVKDVSGSWKVPSVNCNGQPNGTVLFFVGIDGISNGNQGTIEQIGTGSGCAAGEPFYYAWYEFFPNEQTQVEITVDTNGNSFDVRPGDAITASVTFAGGVFTATIVDTHQDGTQQSYTTMPEVVARAKRLNAE